MKTKKQERFLKKYDLTKIVEKRKKGKEFTIPLYIQEL